MKKAFLASFAWLLAGVGLVAAQVPNLTPLEPGPGAPSDRTIIMPMPMPSAEGTTLATPAPAAAFSSSSCQPRFWVSGEYLLWWIKNGPLPVPLVTTGAADPITGGGVLRRPSTSVLFGESGLSSDFFSGGRFGAGAWFDTESKFGIDGSFFFLAEHNLHGFQAASDKTGTPVLTVPLKNALTGAQTGSLVAFPGAFAGGINISAASQLWGAEANGAFNLFRNQNASVTLLGGFRYLDLKETLDLDLQRTVLANGVDFFRGVPVLTGNQIAIGDDFGTRNQFYGGQLGARGEYRFGKASVEVIAKVALGDVHETATVQGTTTLIPPAGPSSTTAGGLLALSSNSGHFSRDQFAVVPEAGFNVGYQVTERLRATVGYTFLYMSEALRPGNQIDRTVNPTLLPTSIQFAPGAGPARPAFNFGGSDFWAQGVSFGLTFRY